MKLDVIDLSNPVWKDPQFPNFYYNEKHLEPFEVRLKNEFKMLNFLGDFGDVAVSEMLENSAIEGVMLSLDKLTSSYLGHVAGPSGKRENNAVAAMKMAIENFDSPLTNEFIKELNCLFNELPQRGQYVGGMHIIQGGRVDRVVVIDRGIPPEMVDEAMSAFVEGYNKQNKETALYNAISGHVHFEKIHPFSDGNGRTGRVLMQMALMRDLNMKHPIALSRAIQKQKAAYYDGLRNAAMDLTQTVKGLEPLVTLAFKETVRISELTDFRKTAYSAQVNDRQRKALEHLISAELGNGYVGKFTSGKYQALTRTSERTALRDCQELVAAGLFIKRGALKGTHYLLRLRNILADAQTG